jgi:hypothetical protein
VRLRSKALQCALLWYVVAEFLPAVAGYKS